MGKYKTIIFDLDGTLLNTLDDLAASVNFSMRQNGMPERTTAEVRRFIGNGVRVLIKRAAPDDITDEEYNAAYKSFEEYYRKHSRDCTAPYDGITDMLRDLKAEGFKLAIVSNKIDFAVEQLRKEFFDGVIDVAVGDSPDTRTKPAPDMVLKAMNALEAIPDECVYVGDTDVDLMTAENANMDCISVSWGFRSRDELVGYKAKMIADKAEDIIKFLK